MTRNLQEISNVENAPVHGLAVVIPVYRSELILPELVQRLHTVLSQITPEYEVVLVNDSSPDRSGT